MRPPGLQPRAGARARGPRGGRAHRLCRSPGGSQRHAEDGPPLPGRSAASHAPRRLARPRAGQCALAIGPERSPRLPAPPREAAFPLSRSEAVPRWSGCRPRPPIRQGHRPRRRRGEAAIPARPEVRKEQGRLGPAPDDRAPAPQGPREDLHDHPRGRSLVCQLLGGDPAEGQGERAPHRGDRAAGRHRSDAGRAAARPEAGRHEDAPRRPPPRGGRKEGEAQPQPRDPTQARRGTGRGAAPR